MVFCSFCGVQVPDNVKFCTSCGKPVPPQNQQAPSQPVVSPQPQAQPYPPLPGSKYEPVSIGGYIGMMLLMLIPIVNIILLLIWACGGCRKVSQANFARAMLLMLLIGTILVILFSLLFKFFLGDTLKSLWQEVEEIKSIIPATGIE